MARSPDPLRGELLFTLIGAKYLTDPVRAATSVKISLGSVAAITSMRVGFGAFPLGFAIIVASCLVSKVPPTRLLVGGIPQYPGHEGCPDLPG